jgi:putative toxin-antitoxin system antitoxin component (TIGR02293 family)
LGIEDVQSGPSLALLRSVRAGLPIAALDNFCGLIAPNDRSFRYRFVPETALRKRRKSTGRLTPYEGDRLVRLAKVFGFALEIYNQPENARAFMHRSHPMLDGLRPIDVVLAADPGADLVLNLLGRAAYGGAV